MSSVNSNSMPDPEATAGSYGAMLHSYAQRNKAQHSCGSDRGTEGYAPGNQSGEDAGYVVGNDEDTIVHEDSYDLNLALSLNYEVRAVLEDRCSTHVQCVCST